MAWLRKSLERKAIRRRRPARKVCDGRGRHGYVATKGPMLGFEGITRHGVVVLHAHQQAGMGRGMVWSQREDAPTVVHRAVGSRRRQVSERRPSGRLVGVERDGALQCCAGGIHLRQLDAHHAQVGPAAGMLRGKRNRP